MDTEIKSYPADIKQSAQRITALWRVDNQRFPVLSF